MITQITTATQTPEVKPSQAPPSKPPQSAATGKDAVHISNAAQTALQEAMETRDQTAKEARNGDRQAQTLLAKEDAAKKAAEG